MTSLTNAPAIQIQDGITKSSSMPNESSLSPTGDAPTFHPTPTNAAGGIGGLNSPKHGSASAALATTQKSPPGVPRTSTINTATITAGLKTNPAVAPAPAPSIVFSGILTKLGKSLINTWRTRFFVLKETAFAYWESEKEYLANMKPLGQLTVNKELHCFSENTNDLEWKFVSSDKTVIVRSTLPDKKAWYDAIDGLVTKIASQHGSDSQTQRKHNNGRPASPSRNGSTGLLESRSFSQSVFGDSSRTLPSFGSDISGAAGEDIAEVDEADDEVGDMFTASREATGDEPIATTSGASTPSKARAESMAVGGGGATTPSSATSTPNARANRARTSGGSLFQGQSNSNLSTAPVMTAEEAAARLEKRRRKSRAAQQLFGWPADEVLIKDFSAAVEKSIMLHGRLYVSEHFLAFASSIFKQVKICVPITDVISVCEVNQALIFPNALKVFVRPASNTTPLPVEAPTPKAAKLLGLDGKTAPSSPTITSTAVPISSTENSSSYFFGSFAPGNRAKAFQLITSLINGTFNPDDYYNPNSIANIIERSRSDSTSSTNSGGEDPTSGNSDVGGGLDGIEDEEGEEEDLNGGDDSTVPAPGDRKLKKLSSSLEFGEHRSALDGTSTEIELKDMLSEEFPGINSRVWFRLFMSDSAPYTGEMYHTTRGDTEYACSSWKDSKLVDGMIGKGWNQVRDTMVRVPVVGSPMGPDSTRVLKVQKMKSDEPGKIVMETVAVTPDVPFGDCFHLRDSWVIQDTPGGCKLTIQLGINIHRSNWKLKAIKSMLISRALGDNQKGFVLYVGEMKNWLSSHPVEVDAVKKVVAATDKKRATLTPSKGKPTPVSSPSNVKAAAPLPVTPKPSPFGPLEPYVKKLPPALQTVPAVAGLAAGAVLLLILLLWFGFGSSSDPTPMSIVHDASTLPVASSTSGASATSNVPPSSSSSTPAATSTTQTIIVQSGSSWMMTLLVTALIGGLGFLFTKVQALEEEVRKLRVELKK